MQITLMQTTDLYEVIYRKNYYKLKVIHDKLLDIRRFQVYGERNQEISPEESKEVLTLIDQFKKEC